jgi:hypothetical protein
MDEDLELQIQEGLKQLEQVGHRLATLKAKFSTGAPLPASRRAAEWSDLHKRIACLITGNEETQALTNQISLEILKNKG